MSATRSLIALTLLSVSLSFNDSTADADPPSKVHGVQAGDVAPSIVALIASGDAIAEKPWDGKYVLIHFWSLDDAARDQQFEKLKQIRREFSGDNRLRMISVCINEDDWDDWLQFQDRQGKVDYGGPRGSFDFFSDHKWWQTCQVSSEIPYSKAYGVENRGELFLVSPDGRLKEVRIPLKSVRESIVNALNAEK